jgi:hypothetical protein
LKLSKVMLQYKPSINSVKELNMKPTMQYKDKFDALTKVVGVKPEEETVASFFWYAGLQHAFQRGTSVPALLQPQVPLKYKEITPTYYDGSTDQLSAKDAKRLSLVLARALQSALDEKVKSKKVVKKGLAHCNPDNPSTSEVFYLVNKERDNLRELTEIIAKFESIQRKLKKLAKGS